ncbi:hypothetical protein HMPREF1129_2938 [Actinomyces naeslundii str. Howell 279]|uniref:Uncharacterized protein n=1 Tax=Actinomyces naeslundii (strain ATCC 12104 / DSM 43013 / CCUG 2238 / JCM 8349 / NCTC 10301 / Howell 279) TaxID=1115803 RepID=J3AC97_ACTNH|nr:hypothetical protein HMPREF1129_2938 [Actinomyces naeslundii str. Howell 279]
MRGCSPTAAAGFFSSARRSGQHNEAARIAVTASWKDVH